MTFIQLKTFDPSILIKYRSKSYTFPLILAVLEGSQAGMVYSDIDRNNFFIMHKFGFADLIETKESMAFDIELYQFFLKKNFLREKIHWYHVPKKWVNQLQKRGEINVLFRERTQFIRDSSVIQKPGPTRCFDHSMFSGTGFLASKLYIIPGRDVLQTWNSQSSGYGQKPHLNESVSIEDISASNYESIESHFNLGLGSRFWSSKQQFLNHSFGVLVYKNGVPAVLCYACAIVNQIAEVDIFTKEAFRGIGLGKIAVAQFIEKCDEKKIKPHWDCYSNNKPSFALAKHFHFQPYHTYTHAIISN